MCNVKRVLLRGLLRIDGFTRYWEHYGSSGVLTSATIARNSIYVVIWDNLCFYEGAGLWTTLFTLLPNLSWTVFFFKKYASSWAWRYFELINLKYVHVADFPGSYRSLRKSNPQPRMLGSRPFLIFLLDTHRASLGREDVEPKWRC